MKITINRKDKGDKIFSYEELKKTPGLFESSFLNEFILSSLNGLICILASKNDQLRKCDRAGYDNYAIDVPDDKIWAKIKFRKVAELSDVSMTLEY